jgi:hypothetical protein
MKLVFPKQHYHMHHDNLLYSPMPEIADLRQTLDL